MNTPDKTEIARWLAEVSHLSTQNVLDGTGGPFAAAIYKNGKMIASGTNRVLVDKDPTAHAEVTAIRNACAILGDFQIDDCILVTSCEPCPMCLGAIYWARPKAVYYCNTREQAADIGFDDDLIYREINMDPAIRKIPFIHMQVAEAAEAFRIWKEKSDKTQY